MKNIIVLMILPLILVCSGCGRSAEHPVRWTSAIKLRSYSDISKQMNAKVDMSKSGGELVLTGPYPKESKRKVATCREYLSLIGQGYGAQTTYDISMESWFVDRCGPLALMVKARPSRVSFLDKFDISKNPLSDLPASAYPALSGDEVRDVAAAEKAGKRLGSFDPGAKVKTRKRHATTIQFDGMEATYDQVAWGDFNHDGIEDVLIFRSEHAPGGSYRSYEHFLLTKNSTNTPIVMSAITPGSKQPSHQ